MAKDYYALANKAANEGVLTKKETRSLGILCRRLINHLPVSDSFTGALRLQKYLAQAKQTVDISAIREKAKRDKQ